MTKTLKQLCEAIEAGYAAEKSGLDEDMIDLVLELADRTGEISNGIEQWRQAAFAFELRAMRVEYVLRLLVLAGHATQEKVDQALELARDFKRADGVQACDQVQMPDKARAGIEVLHQVVESLLTTSRYVDEEGEATQDLADLAACIANPPFKLKDAPGVQGTSNDQQEQPR